MAEDVRIRLTSGSIPFSSVLAQQASFQARLGDLELPEDERIARIEHLANLMAGETHDMLDDLGYKRHRAFTVPNWDNALTEWVDQFKYLLAIAAVAGWDANRLMTAFEDKGDLVWQRWQSDRDEDRAIPCAVFDMDGVICRYEEWGDEAIAEGAFENAIPNLDIISFMKVVQQWGLRIIIVTSRKQYRWKRIATDTERWLRLNNVPYDAIRYSYDKFAAVDGFNVLFAVEDSPKHALNFASSGVRTYYVAGRHGGYGGPGTENLYICEDHIDLVNQIANYMRERDTALVEEAGC